MTRPIDADALKLSHCKECTLYPDKCMGDDCDWDAIIHINAMPTIDAIPVSFIQELIDRDKQLIEEYGGKQDYEIIVDGLIERAVNYEALIEKWREKNGKEVS